MRLGFHGFLIAIISSLFLLGSRCSDESSIANRSKSASDTIETNIKEDEGQRRAELSTPEEATTEEPEQDFEDPNSEDLEESEDSLNEEP